MEIQCRVEDCVAGNEKARVFHDLLATRYSCRGYLPRPVPQAIIMSILHVAQRTASWSNIQPWQVLITLGAETDRFRSALYAHAEASQRQPDLPWPREYRDIYAERRKACGVALYKAVGVARGDHKGARRQSLENYRFFGAPHVAIITSDEPIGVYGAIDCGGYIANFMSAAQAFGVSCIAQAAIAAHAPFIREYFGLESDRIVICGISFGYGDERHPANGFRTNRASFDEVVTFLGGNTGVES